ncbi:hypothetical protein PLESTB_000769300 [Pleodorina starrii]|uniref:Tr-type G domain-containing protein n=1 Tax=Pleodorina starrii TaxID=330485 RepID=A0A9W6BL91_9CHLO|nr:hypothetical protein PLESTM_000436000 [Pleodorina starrii]GLC53617.1 hypothetical protein PLESTB_000769300 [Pleodorina starrii]GLC65688.1 hypothetical protein PLESTF_000329100 [Pleodorina starrii]
MSASTSADAMPHATVVFVGHHKAGKSTAVGHMLVKLGGVDKRTWERVERETSTRPASRYSWIVDRLRLERDRGLTLDIKLHRLALPPTTAASPGSLPLPSSSSPSSSSAGLVLTLVDTPGHPDCLKSTIAGITQADVAVLVVDSRPTVLDSPAFSGQTRDLAHLATALIDKRCLVVAVNLVDVVVEGDPAVAEQRFQDASETIKRLLKRLTPLPPVLVPVSALTGDNLTEPSPRMTWWPGPSLTGAVAAAVEGAPGVARESKEARDAAARPLRIPLIGTFKVGGIGTVPAGRLAGGSIRQGTSAQLLPPPASPSSSSAAAASTAAWDAAGGGGGGDGRLAAAVRSLESFHDARAAAAAGEWVGLAVKGVHASRLRRGCVVSEAGDRPARLAASFTARVQVLRDPTSKRPGKSRCLGLGYCALVHVHTAQAPCLLRSIKTFNKKGEVVSAAATHLREGDIAEVELAPLVPLVVEPYTDYPALGRFAVRAAVRADPDFTAAFSGLNGGGGGGGPMGQSGPLMAPVIVALGRVEAVKYMEPAPEPAPRSPVAEARRAAQPGQGAAPATTATTTTSPAPVAASPHVQAHAKEAEPASTSMSTAEATVVAVAAAVESSSIPLIDITSNGDDEGGHRG